MKFLILVIEFKVTKYVLELFFSYLNYFCKKCYQQKVFGIALRFPKIIKLQLRLENSEYFPVDAN